MEEVKDSQTLKTLEVVNKFNEATNRQDVDGMMSFMTDGCIFENTNPPPDGKRFQGHNVIRACWEDLFKSAKSVKFEEEEIFACGDRCVVRWRYDWVDLEGKPGHIRGVDVLKIREGKIAEKLAYVKG